MGIVKSIVEKLKVKELFAIVFIAALIITFVPDEWAQKMKIDTFRRTYQTYISLCMIGISSYYLLCFLGWIKKFIWKKMHNREKMAINYMKKYMSPDEMLLLIETFYNEQDDRFCSSGKIDYCDGRKAPLESKNIIYLASQMGNILEGFSYNLQPFALQFLNKNLKQGNIVITNQGARWQLK